MCNRHLTHKELKEMFGLHRYCCIVQGLMECVGNVGLCRECWIVQGMLDCVGIVGLCRDCWVVQGMLDCVGNVGLCRECWIVQRMLPTAHLKHQNIHCTCIGQVHITKWLQKECLRMYALSLRTFENAHLQD